MLGFQIPNDSYLLSETVLDKKDRKFRRAARANTNKEEEKQHEQFFNFRISSEARRRLFSASISIENMARGARGF